MLVCLRGILETGEPLAIGVPTDTRTTLSIPAVSSATVRVYITTPTGEPVDLVRISATAKMAVRQTPSNVVPFIELTGTASPGKPRGYVDFSITALSTKYATPGRYTYTVWLLTSTSIDVVIPASPFNLLPATLLR